MKFSILLSSAVLFATALTPISAYADDSNLMCRRSTTVVRENCTGGTGGGNLSISGHDINVKSSDRGNDKRNSDTKTQTKTNDDNDTGPEHADAGNTDNDADAGNTDTGGGNVDPGTDNNDTGGSNNSPPQQNSNHIDGFDPFGGLYGPGT